MDAATQPGRKVAWRLLHEPVGSLSVGAQLFACRTIRSASLGLGCPGLLVGLLAALCFHSFVDGPEIVSWVELGVEGAPR